MADSELLKDFKAVWGDSCQSMWAELLSITMAQSYVVTNYKDLPKDMLLTDMFYTPELQNRLRDLRRDTFLERVSIYQQRVITNRIVILSASFETYFSRFLDVYIANKPKFYDQANSCRTAAGNKLYGDVMKIRGLSERIIKFGELAPSKIKSIVKLLSYLDDVYMLRNVLAHRAGLVDAHAASTFTHVRFSEGERVILTSENLLELAAPVVRIAQNLDAKLS